MTDKRTNTNKGAKKMHYAYCYKCKKHLIVESDLSACPTCHYEVVLLSQSGMQQYATKRRILAGITGATKRK